MRNIFRDPKIKEYLVLHKRKIITATVIAGVIIGGVYFLNFAKNNKTLVASKTLSAFNKIFQLLPVSADLKKELAAVDELTKTLTEKNDKTWNFLVLLQNNMELRPGGGFLGQYAVVKIKNGEVVSTYIEDGNLVDQRTTAKVSAPYPFQKILSIRKWKFTNSNFSPNFPTNAEKAKYFLRLGGRGGDYDGVIAVNASVLDNILELTGPISVPGYAGTFTSQDATIKIEDIVEKQYLLNPDLDTQNRKNILKSMANIIIDKLFSLNNISKVASFAHEEMKKKDVMLNFKDTRLQQLVEGVFWDGKVAEAWGGDYLMAVDANMGALKTDYYMRREINYEIDLTQERPIATLNILYKNTAPYGNWRTSDYHSYLRVYVPKGSELLERKMVGSPYIKEEFGKTYFGVKVDVLIGGETNAMLKYQLPADFDKNDYKLLIQKQSGAGKIPVKVKVKSDKGELSYDDLLVKDLKFEIKENQE